MHHSFDIADRATAQCPVHPAVLAGLQPADELALPMSRRMVVQHGTTEDGRPELVLYYEDKEVSFDEPELFAFGETLARQTRFRADAATRWGESYDWQQVKPLLESLLEVRDP